MFHFSVIIPTRNRNNLLKRAVHSVLNQNSVSFEIIVIDDGSEDHNTIEEYLKQFGIIYLKTTGGKGGGYSRNIGLDHASGELIAFLDDDDYWAPDKLQKQAQLMEDNDAGLCYTGVSVCKPNGSLRYSFRKPRYTDLFLSIMKQNFIGTTSSVVVRKSIIQKIGGFDISLPALQDYDLFIRILRHCQACWISEPLTFYDDQGTCDRVSFSRRRYLDAVSCMLKKYENEKHYPVLRRSLKNIQLLKIYRSKQFLIETMKSIFMNKRDEKN